MYQKIKMSSVGDLLYLFGTNTSSFQTGKNRFWQDNVGSFVIGTVFDSTHYTL